MSARRTTRRDDALRWSRLAELSVDRNETPVSSRIDRLTKFGALVRRHIEDMTAVGKLPPDAADPRPNGPAQQVRRQAGQGRHCCSRDDAAVLRNQDLVVSMNGKGNCHGTPAIWRILTSVNAEPV